MVALVTRRTAPDLFDAHRIIAMPGLDWAKIWAATLMIGASAKSFDCRTASPADIGCEVGDTTGGETITCRAHGAEGPSRCLTDHGIRVSLKDARLTVTGAAVAPNNPIAPSLEK